MQKEKIEITVLSTLNVLVSIHPKRYNSTTQNLVLGLLTSFVHFIHPYMNPLQNFVNFDRFRENQYLRNFPLRVHLQKLIPAKKVFEIYLQKLIVQAIYSLTKTKLQKLFFFALFNRHK